MKSSLGIPSSTYSVLRKTVMSSQGTQPSTYVSTLGTSGTGVRQDNQGLASMQAERTQSGSATDVVSSLVPPSLLPILLDS